MSDPDPNSDRQFYWGLSFGIIVLALSGFIWVGWAFSALESPVVGITCLVLDAIFAGCLIRAGVRVRRKAQGFRYSDMRKGTDIRRAANRKTGRRFGWVILGEWTGIGLAAFATYHFGRGDLFPPAMSLSISLHFFPLAWIFRLPVYNATASASALLCITLLLIPAAALGPDARLILNGLGFGAVMWGTAVYFVFNSAPSLSRLTV